MKGRTIIYISIAFVAGDIVTQLAGYIYPVPLWSILIAAVANLAITAKYRYTSTAYITFALLGAISASIGGIPGEGLALMKVAEDIKLEISNYISSLITDKHLEAQSILRALIIGDKSHICRELRDIYSISGGSHLLALSGLHIGVVYMLLSSIFKILGNSRISRSIRGVIIILTLWAYAFISGMSSSIARAVTMLTIYEISPLFNSKRSLMRALAISALIITLFNPDAPFEIGFQLSYLAMIAIGTIFPHINNLWNIQLDIAPLPIKTPLHRRILSMTMGTIWSTLALSISCQLLTAPLVWLYFGNFPIYFMVTNIIAIPLVTATIYLTPLAIITTKIPPLGEVFSNILTEIIELLNLILKTISEC
jgi:competence protein ComEC